MRRNILISKPRINGRRLLYNYSIRSVAFLLSGHFKQASKNKCWKFGLKTNHLWVKANVKLSKNGRWIVSADFKLSFMDLSNTHFNFNLIDTGCPLKLFTLSLKVNCASHVSQILKCSISFFSWIKIQM